MESFNSYTHSFSNGETLASFRKGRDLVLADIKEHVDTTTGNVIPAHKALVFFTAKRNADGTKMRDANGALVPEQGSVTFVDFDPSVSGMTIKEISEVRNELEVGTLSEGGNLVLYRPANIRALTALNTPRDLLALLNRILIKEKGPSVPLFSFKQLHYFSNPSWNKKLYTSFFIPKKSGDLRCILSPTKNLRCMQRCINLLLQSLYHAPVCVTGFTKNRSIVDNACFHIGRDYLFNADLKDFFTSITYERVYNSLLIKPFEFTPSIARIIAGLCCTETTSGKQVQAVLPQGAPTSPIVANIVCIPLDRKCSGLARRFGASYSRYADDITFSSDKNMFFEGSDFMISFQRIIASQQFSINHDKDRVQNYAGRQVVTGLVVNQKVNVSKQFIRDLENLLFIWERYGREIAKIKFCQKHPNYKGRKGFDKSFESIVKGKLNYLRMVRGEDDSLFNKLRVRFESLLCPRIPL